MYIYIIFYNQTWQWKIHYDYTRIIIRISIDDCPIKTSIYGEFSIAIFDYQRIHIILSSWAYQNQSPCFRLRFVGRTCGLSHCRWCLKYVQIISICIWLVVSTPLKNISQIGSSSQLLGKIKKCSKPPTRYSISASKKYLCKFPAPFSGGPNLAQTPGPLDASSKRYCPQTCSAWWWSFWIHKSGSVLELPLGFCKLQNSLTSFSCKYRLFLGVCKLSFFTNGCRGTWSRKVADVDNCCNTTHVGCKQHFSPASLTNWRCE